MRKARGTASNLKGNFAEDAAEAHYESLGAKVAARRYRCSEGEIDLIVNHGGLVIFVEVKARKTIEAALASVSLRQWGRIIASAQAYLSETNQHDTEHRFDLFALDTQGAFTLIQNATQDFM